MGAALRIPARRIHLTNGETLDVYDSSGPQGIDPREGLPKLRAEWIAGRRAKADGRDRCVMAD